MKPRMILSFCFTPFFCEFRIIRNDTCALGRLGWLGWNLGRNLGWSTAEMLASSPSTVSSHPPKHVKNNGFDFRMIRLKPRTEPRMDTHQFSGFRRPTPKPRTEPGMKLSLELQASPGCKPLHSHGMRNKAERLGWLGGNLGRNLGWQVELFGAFLSQSGSVTGLAKNVKIPVLGTHFILKRRMKRFFHPSGKFHPNL